MIILTLFMPKINSVKFQLWSGPVSVLFAPVVENDYGDSQERFLTDEPIELLKKGEINSVPLIIGMTADEMTHISYSKYWYSKSNMKNLFLLKLVRVSRVEKEII